MPEDSKVIPFPVNPLDITSLLFHAVQNITDKLASIGERLERVEKSIAANYDHKELVSILKDIEAAKDGWLDAKAAAQYMGGMCESTFDKYRYNTNPKLKGYSLGGKVYYKKGDIDLFIRLFALKAG
ncbi:MAG: hypothetical protein WCH57_06165 [Verrucomicrobiota bacterium]